MMNLHTPPKPPSGHPQATLRLSGSQPVGTLKPPSGYPEATPRLPWALEPAESQEIGPQSHGSEQGAGAGLAAGEDGGGQCAGILREGRDTYGAGRGLFEGSDHAGLQRAPAG